MANKRLSVDVRGREKRWSFEFMGDPKCIEEWRADGLEVFEIENTVPAWVVDFGLVKPWCFVQDLFNFKNPLKR